MRWDAAMRLINRALAGVNYLLTVAVSVVVIILAVVLFRSLVTGGSDAAADTTTTLTGTTRAPGATTTTPFSTTTFTPASTRAPTCSALEPEPADGVVIIRVYYGCGLDPEPSGGTWVYRGIDEDAPLIQTTMELLVAGPNGAERADGFRSLFTSATADAVIDTTRRRGAVTVDLRSLGPQPSLTASTEGEQFLADLNNTLFQHEVVETIEYRIEGSCEDFWAYFGETGCLIVEREQWVGSPTAAPEL